MQITYLFGGVLILIAVVMILKSTTRSDWVKSFLLFIFLVILSSLNFIVMIFISFLLIRHPNSLYLGNLFILFAIFITISGIILYWWLNFLKHIINYDDTVLTLMEYYIQWSLIYVTIYQTIFSNIKRVTDLPKFIKIGNLLDPNMFITFVLPSFISVWIGIILYKKHTHEI